MITRKCIGVVLAVITVSVWLTSAIAQPGANDERIVRDAQRIASSGRVDVYALGVEVHPEFAAFADRALTRMEQEWGRPFDEAALGPRVAIYVSHDTTVSHVWRGYDHRDDPRAVLFLNPRVVRGGMQGRNATYAHELAHLLTWRFNSHTLREGLADYLALQVHPGAGVGPNPDGYGSPPPVPERVDAYLGTNRPAPTELSTDATFRSAYYYASWRFVDYAIRLGGMEMFAELYAAPDPEVAIVRLYGMTRAELVSAAAIEAPSAPESPPEP